MSTQIDPRLAERLLEKKALLDARRPLPSSTVRRLHDELRVSLTYHSNAIEGNTLSLRETMLVIEHGITIGEHSLKEHLEARNHAEAFDYVAALATRQVPIDDEVILALHRIVMDKNLPSAGAYRTGPVRIRGSLLQPPHSREVPRLMREWAAWLEEEGRQYPPVVRSAIAHHGFVAVHPFEDGNGRTGRLLLNLLLMQDGFPPAMLLREWRAGYIEALSTADRGTYRPIINLVGRAVEQALELYLEACAVTPEEEWLPLSALAPTSGHSSEYLSLLIRKGRLAGVKRGSRWYSSQVAIERYKRDVAEDRFPGGRPRSERNDPVS
jgi:Fic family protein